MFCECNQIQHWEQQICQMNWSFQDYLGNFQEVFIKKYRPWQCPECLQRFRWDEQLRRHQIKMNHINIDRIQRREKKYKKLEFYSCKRCQIKFNSHLERIKHYRWCQRDPRTEKTRESYRSSWSKHAFECKNHEVAYYFTSFEKLKEHLKTHRARNLIQNSRMGNIIPINKYQPEFEKEISSTQGQNKTEYALDGINMYFKVNLDEKCQKIEQIMLIKQDQ